MMKTAIVLSALAILGVQAQQSGAQGSTAGGFDISTFLGGVLGAGNLPSVLGGLGAIASQGSVPLGPAPQGCAPYEVLFARGTFEPGPYGVVVGDPLLQAIQKDMRGETVRGYAVQYPASMTGSDTGIKDVVNRVTSKAKECPSMKFALVGYSQGGMVVSAAAPQIPADVRQKVAAVVLYGAGNGAGGGMPSIGARPSGAAAAAPRPSGAPGGGAFSFAAPLPDIKEKTLANCAPGDMCGNPAPQGAINHLTYGSTGTAWHTRSAKYITDAFHGKPGGYKLELSPT